LTTFNGERFLAQQLDSIYAQTHRNIEVVVCDDRSEDRTVEILEQYRQDHALRYSINDSRLGFVNNFGKVISLCKGEFIALSDQDDIWEPKKIEILMNEIGDNDLICSDMSLIDDKSEPIAPSFRQALQVPFTNDSTQFSVLAYTNFVTGCTILMRREFAHRHLPVPLEAMSHDWWFGICAARERRLKFLDLPLVKYRQHDANAIGARQLWEGRGMLRFVFSRERKEVYQKELRRIRYYLANGVSENDEQKMFLESLQRHFSSIVSTSVHTEAFAIAFRYREVLFPNVDLLHRWIYLLGRLV
jgi:glycosyltransferase involved in cell wall biosynthesis